MCPATGTRGIRALADLNVESRRRHLEQMAERRLDLLVVGGGITGAGAALDAALRGLDVGLVEARDLAAGTSSASSKLIHGGLRYLEMGDVGLVREALRERELLLTRLAPHLVAPVPFLWPLRGPGWERLYLGTGLVLYDTLGGARSVPRHRHLTRRGVEACAPGLRVDRLVGGVRFFDAAEDDARLVLTVARTAAASGARIATRARVREFVREGARVAGAVIADEETGETVTVRARHVALAAGPWTDELSALAGASGPPRLRPSKGVHLTVARERIRSATGILARTEKSVLFVIPTAAGWLIGDTDTPWTLGPDGPIASGADVDYLLARTNALLTEPLSRADVRGVFAGLRPLVAAEGVSDTTRLSRRHVIASPLPGLTTIAGGKLTTYRVMAADLVDAATRERGGVPASRTATVPLVGAAGFARAWERRAGLAREAGLPVAAVERLLRRYGDRTADLLALVASRPTLGEPLHGGEGQLAVEVVYACTHEGALRLEDVLARRTRLAIDAVDRGVAAAGRVAEIMAGELGWNDARTSREVDAWRRHVAGQRAAEDEPDDERALAAYRSAVALAASPEEDPAR
jgi:glycerol-3-phosphate dehydrogenase